MFKSFQNWIITEKKGIEYEYSSILFLFPSKDAQAVLEWSKQHIPDSLLYKEGDEKGREDEIHVTVLYGLHTNDPDPVREIASEWSPFSITLGEISKFESDNYDVIKVAVSGSELHKANKSLQKLDYTSTFKDYKPHCTLAYVKKGSCDDLLGDKNFSGRDIAVKSVVFSPAEGERSSISLTE